MVNPLSGGAQQPFGTLYQPGGAAKTDPRPSSGERGQETGKSEGSTGPSETRKAESPSSLKSTSVSYAGKQESGDTESGGRSRGNLLDITV